MKEDLVDSRAPRSARARTMRAISMNLRCAVSTGNQIPVQGQHRQGQTERQINEDGTAPSSGLHDELKAALAEVLLLIDEDDLWDD